MKVSRRTVLSGGAAGAASVFVTSGGVVHALPVRGPGVLDPSGIPKYRSALLVPTAMPRSSSGAVDRYVIGVRQLRQQVLPRGLPRTTVWGFGSETTAGTYNAPSLSIEARVDHPVEVTWVNRLVDGRGRFLPHLLPVDPTLHWANPGGGEEGRDGHPMFMEHSRPVPRAGAVRRPPPRWAHGGGQRRVPAVVVPAGGARHPARLRPGGVDLRTDVRAVPARPRGRLGAGQRPRALRQRPGGRHAVVPRPLARHHPAQRLRRPGRLLPPARRAPTTSTPGCCPATARGCRRTRSRSPSRTAPSAATARCSTPTPASTSTGSPGRTCPTRTSRRCGTRSSSATPSWSTAAPGPTTRSSAGATGCGCSTGAVRGSSSSPSRRTRRRAPSPRPRRCGRSAATAGSWRSRWRWSRSCSDPPSGPTSWSTSAPSRPAPTSTSSTRRPTSPSVAASRARTSTWRTPRRRVRSCASASSTGSAPTPACRPSSSAAHAPAARAGGAHPRPRPRRGRLRGAGRRRPSGRLPRRHGRCRGRPPLAGTTPSPRTRSWATPRSGRSTTPRRTRTRSTCTSCSSGGRPPGPRAAGPPARGRTRAAPRTPSSPTRARSPASGRTSTRPGLFVWHCHILEHEDHEMMRPFRVG